MFDLEEKSMLIKTIRRLIKYQLSTYVTSAKPLYILEAKYTLHRLLQTLGSASLQDTPNRLINILRNRWSMIKGTDLQYCHDFTNPANKACTIVAKTLYELDYESQVVLLMPSLSVISPEQYIVSDYNTPNLNLKEFILSDCNTRLISIVDVLDFAVQDGELKHNSLFSGQKKELSTKETHRLLLKHYSVMDHYNSIQDKVNFQLYGETAGAYIQRLINGLHKGDVKHEGTEEVAGEAATLAISEFGNYLDTLTKKQRNTIMSAKTLFSTVSLTRRELSFRTCWERLYRKTFEESNVGTYCVELIANDICKILDDNPQLYEITAYQDLNLINLTTLEDNVQATRKTMVQSLKALSVTPSVYGDASEGKLIDKLMHKIVADETFSLELADIDCIDVLCTESRHIIPEDRLEQFNVNCSTILTRARKALEPITVASEASKRKITDYCCTMYRVPKKPRDSGLSSEYKREFEPRG